MMNKIKYYALIMLCASSMILFSCNKEKGVVPEVPESPKPMADFSFSIVATDDPFTFKFENKSKDFKSVKWEFGDDVFSTELNPVHTYEVTGEFRVRIIALNDQGYWAQKETKIKLLPDSVMSIGSTPVGNGQLTLKLTGDLVTSSVSWYKIEGGASKLIEKAETTTITVPVGVYDTYSARITTPNGSRAELVRLVGSAGVLKDVSRGGIFTVNKENDYGTESKEGSLKLVDNNVETKFVQFNYKGDFWARFDYKEKLHVVNAYSISSADDYIERDPKDFSLEGTDDLNEWTVLDERKNEIFLKRKQTKTYIFENKIPYRYYRLRITANGGAGLVQLSEWRMMVIQ